MNKLNIILIIFSLAMIFAKIAQDPFLSGWGYVLSDVILLIYLILFIFLFLLVLFLLRLGVDDAHKAHKVLYFLFALLISCLFISLITFMPDDEIILAYYGYHSFIQGLNPYAQNYSQGLIPTLHSLGTQGTVTSTGGIVATYGYPALYFLVQAPFFALFNPNSLNLGQIVMPVEYMAFFGFFLLVYWQVTKEKKSRVPIYSAIALASIAFLVFSSTVVILMLALMLLLYTEIGKKYCWLVLGLMASLQQQLWIFVLIFLMYYLNTMRSSDSLKVLWKTIAVFLIINGYFILLSPAAFFGSFLAVGDLAPNSIGPIAGVLMLMGFPSSWLIWLFLGSTIAVIAIGMGESPYWFPLLSAVPFLFLGHSLPIYFMLPFSAYALIQDDDNARAS